MKCVLLVLSCWCCHFEAGNTKLITFYHFSWNKKLKCFMFYHSCRESFRGFFGLFWGRGESARDPWGWESCDCVEGWCETDLAGLNPVSEVLFFSLRPRLRLSNRAGTFWTSSGMCFLLTSLPGLPSDRAWAVQWEGSWAQWGLLVCLRAPSRPPCVLSPGPRGVSTWRHISKQTGDHQASRIIVPACSRRTD